jgi:hypothetical protein
MEVPKQLDRTLIVLFRPGFMLARWTRERALISVSTNGSGADYVVANTNANVRTGIITIAGQPFTVSQYGKGRRPAAGR